MTDKPDWKIYSASITINDRLFAFSADVMGELMRQAHEEHVRHMWDVVMGPPKPVPVPTRWQRARSWLGWKTWALAIWLEPDCGDC